MPVTLNMPPTKSVNGWNSASAPSTLLKPVSSQAGRSKQQHQHHGTAAEHRAAHRDIFAGQADQQSHNRQHHAEHDECQRVAAGEQALDAVHQVADQQRTKSSQVRNDLVFRQGGDKVPMAMQAAPIKKYASQVA